MQRLQTIFPYMLAPLLILFGGLSIYFMLSAVISLLESELTMIEKLEAIVVNQPERAANCGVEHHILSLKNLNEALSHTQSALHNFLIGGTIGLFIILAAREIHVFIKCNKST